MSCPLSAQQLGMARGSQGSGLSQVHLRLRLPMVCRWGLIWVWADSGREGLLGSVEWRAHVRKDLPARELFSGPHDRFSTPPQQTWGLRSSWAAVLGSSQAGQPQTCFWKRHATICSRVSVKVWSTMETRVARRFRHCAHLPGCLRNPRRRGPLRMRGISTARLWTTNHTRPTQRDAVETRWRRSPTTCALQEALALQGARFLRGVGAGSEVVVDRTVAA